MFGFVLIITGCRGTHWQRNTTQQMTQQAPAELVDTLLQQLLTLAQLFPDRAPTVCRHVVRMMGNVKRECPACAV